MRVTLHGGPKDGWAYDVDEAVEIIRLSAWTSDDERLPIEQARDPANFQGVYIRRGESTDYDWHSEVMGESRGVVR